MNRATAIAQLVALQRCGVQLPHGPALEALLREVDSGHIATSLHLLAALDRFPRSVMLVEHEALVADHDRYGAIAARVGALCGDALPLTGILSTRTTLSFALDGDRYRLEYDDDDWMGGTVFADLAALLVMRDSPMRLVKSHAGEILYCVHERDLHALAAHIHALLVAEGSTSGVHEVEHVHSSPARLARARGEGGEPRSKPASPVREPPPPPPFSPEGSPVARLLALHHAVYAIAGAHVADPERAADAVTAYLEANREAVAALRAALDGLGPLDEAERARLLADRKEQRDALVRLAVEIAEAAPGLFAAPAMRQAMAALPTLPGAS